MNEKSDGPTMGKKTKSLQYTFIDEKERDDFYGAMQRYNFTSGAGFVQACVQAIITAKMQGISLLNPIEFAGQKK